MDIKELKSFNLSDAVRFHDKLNPALWTADDEMQPAVKKQLMIIAKDFMEYLGLTDLKVEDITISGSNAAYSYTPHSDIDLHLLVDFNKLPKNEIYKELFSAKKTVYNDSHDIKIHGVPVELYVQDTNEPHVSLGEYSILNDDWIKIPVKRKANLSQANTKLKYEKLGNMIEAAINSDSLEKVKRMMDKLKQYRKAGLAKTGEFGPENLAYKLIRQQGLLQKLIDTRNKLHSEKLSIEEEQLDEVFDYEKKEQVELTPGRDTLEYKFKTKNGNDYAIFFDFDFEDPMSNMLRTANLELKPGISKSAFNNVAAITFARYIPRLGGIGRELTFTEPSEQHNDQFEVFREVMKAVISYIENKKPPYFMFKPVVEDSKKGSTRIKIYNRLIDKIMKLYPTFKRTTLTYFENSVLVYDTEMVQSKLKENTADVAKLDKPTLSVEALLSQHNEELVMSQLKTGIETELEHTSDLKTAMKIALAHLGEDIRYYTKLQKAGLEESENTVDYMAGHCHVMAIALKRLHPDWKLRAHIGWDEDAETDDEYEIDHVYIVAPDGTAWDCRGKFKNEAELVGPDETGGVETQFVDYDLSDIEHDIQIGKLKPFAEEDIQKAIEFSRVMNNSKLEHTENKKTVNESRSILFREIRSNPSKNVKKTTRDVVSTYIKKFKPKECYVHFSPIEKVGINPKSANTYGPLGVYAFPIEVTKKVLTFGKHYFRNTKFANILLVTEPDKMLDLDTVSLSTMKNLLESAINFHKKKVKDKPEIYDGYRQNATSVKKIYQDIQFLLRNYGTRRNKLKTGTSLAVLLNSFYRKHGFTSIRDTGLIINDNPHQIVFLVPSAYRIIETVPLTGLPEIEPISLTEFSESASGCNINVTEGGAETSWSDGNEKVTLQDILELTKHIKQIDLPINDNLKSKLIHWDGNPEEIERINQVTVSNQFPILVMLDAQGQIDWILDGNHRLHKAIRSQAKTIPAKLIRPSDLDDKARKVFHIKERSVAESASGYIPSDAEKDDPRYKTALTVDIKPDTMRKNAKKFGWKISRSGIPPLLRK